MLTKNEKIYYNDVWQKIEKKIICQNERLGDLIPYISFDGKYTDRFLENKYWWTNGFWSGALWYAYDACKNEELKNNAAKIELRLDESLDGYEGLHHDVGFMWLLTSVANYKITGNEKSKTRAMHAASLLAGRFNLRGKYIRAWNMDKVGWVIIDSMMNLPLLYWASEISNDPRFKYVAIEHADTAMKYLLRADGSVNHIAVLDEKNGELLDIPAGQGYASGSSWSRGQAWALYGFALSFLHTKEQKYLDAAKQIAHYFISNVAATDYVSLVDFRAPKEPVKWDTTATAIAVCGLIQIAELLPDIESNFYFENAKRMLKALINNHCDFDINTDGILINGTEAYHKEDGIHVKIVYGDYYLTEAIRRLLGSKCFFW